MLNAVSANASSPLVPFTDDTTFILIPARCRERIGRGGGGWVVFLPRTEPHCQQNVQVIRHAAHCFSKAESTPEYAQTFATDVRLERCATTFPVQILQFCLKY